MRANVLAVGFVALIVGAAIGALAYKNFVQPIKAGYCTSQDDHCIDVNVVMVNGKPKIPDIGDDYFTKPGAIFWTIKTAGYSFSANGVDFVNIGNKSPQPSDPSLEFKNCKVMPQDSTTFKCENTHQHYNPPATYGYKVTVENPPGTVAASLDPFIINGP